MSLSRLLKSRFNYDFTSQYMLYMLNRLGNSKSHKIIVKSYENAEIG